nr:MAG TPA: DNA polymerase sliding clamp [Caudoviricetes sp.]
MKFSLYDISALTNFLKGVSNVADEITFFASEDGLKCQVTSKSMVTMFEVFFKRSYFELFEVEGNEAIRIVPSDLFKILRTVKRGESLIFDVDAYKLHIIIDGNRRRNFTISLLDEYDNFRELPSFDLNIESVVNLDFLLDSLKDLDLMASPVVTLTSKDEDLKFYGLNEYKGAVECAELGKTNNDGKATYNINNFKDVINFPDISNEVKLKFDNDYPAVFEFEDDDVELTTLIAPILEQE